MIKDHVPVSSRCASATNEGEDLFNPKDGPRYCISTTIKNMNFPVIHISLSLYHFYVIDYKYNDDHEAAGEEFLKIF